MNDMIGKRLKELRNEAGLTQTKVAKAIGVSEPTISLWERGERTPNIEMLSKLCDFYDVSADYLLGRVDFY